MILKNNEEVKLNLPVVKKLKANSLSTNEKESIFINQNDKITNISFIYEENFEYSNNN